MDVSEEVVEDLQTTLLSGVTEETDLDDTGDPGVTEEGDLGGTSDPGVTEEADLGSPNDLNQSSEHRGFPDEQLQRDTTYTVTLGLWNKIRRYLYALACSYFFTLCFWCLVSPLFQCKPCEPKWVYNKWPDHGPPHQIIKCSHDDFLMMLFVWLPVSVCTIYLSFPGNVFPFLGRYEDKWYWHRFLLGMLTWTLLLIIYFGTANLCELHFFDGRPPRRDCPTPNDCYDDKFNGWDGAWYSITQLLWLASWIIISIRLSRNVGLCWCTCGPLVFIWSLYHFVVMIPYFACDPDPIIGGC